MSLPVWTLSNLDTGEEITGQFGAEELTEDAGAAEIAAKHALNRDIPIQQWVHGNAREFTFTGRFWLTKQGLIAAMMGEEKPKEPVQRLDLLRTWIKRDTKLRRPPVLMFWVGDTSVYLHYCLIKSLSNIRYEDFETGSGKVKHVSFDIALVEYLPFDKSDAPSKGETRYHYVKQGEYYELMCQREYGDPMMGDVIRKRHPTLPLPVPGERIKLPSYRAIRTNSVEPTSVQLQNAFTRGTAPQRALRIAVFEARNVDYYSLVLDE